MLISSFFDIVICLTTILLGYLAYNDFTTKIIWILNKIDSLDIANKNNTVRCEFIKVQNINNYAAGNS